MRANLLFRKGEITFLLATIVQKIVTTRILSFLLRNRSHIASNKTNAQLSEDSFFDLSYRRQGKTCVVVLNAVNNLPLAFRPFYQSE